MDVADIRQHVTAEARFRIQPILCKIHDTLFSPVSIIPPEPHTHVSFIFYECCAI